MIRMNCYCMYDGAWIHQQRPSIILENDLGGVTLDWQVVVVNPVNPLNESGQIPSGFSDTVPIGVGANDSHRLVYLTLIHGEQRGDKKTFFNLAPGGHYTASQLFRIPVGGGGMNPPTSKRPRSGDGDGDDGGPAKKPHGGY